MHRARRSQCKGWWNDKWRGLIGAAVSWLAAGEAVININVGTTAKLLVAATPLRLECPVSFDEKALALVPDGNEPTQSDGEEVIDDGFAADDEDDDL